MVVNNTLLFYFYKFAFSVSLWHHVNGIITFPVKEMYKDYTETNHYCNKLLTCRADKKKFSGAAKYA